MRKATPAAGTGQEGIAELRSLLANPKRLAQLMTLEKKRRGTENGLVFIGLANVAEFYWCAMQAVLKSRASELEFFKAYLADRLGYSLRLGLIRKLSRTNAGILNVGNEITLADVEKLLKQEREKQDQQATQANNVRVTWACQESKDDDGNPIMLINPDLSPQDKAYFAADAAKRGIRVIDLTQDHKLRGRVLEHNRAERYPTIRWNFAWGPYVVVGVPDGLTDDFVYEYKTHRSRYLAYVSKPSTMTQANLYAYFFQRPAKRVQIYVGDEDKTDTLVEPVDRAKAESALEGFRKVNDGIVPEPPKQTWKCKKCEVRELCAICPLGGK